MPKLMIALVFFALTNVALAAQETLKNDGFTDGGLVNFQAGFITGEIAAARFEPTISCPCVLESVTLLFGGSNVTREMGVRVWDDGSGSDTPGIELFSGVVNLTGANDAFQLIDLTQAPIVVDGPFRVGLEFGHSGLPGVATDLDGTIDASANFIFADLGGFFVWFPSSLLGVSGDFVIRATVNNGVVQDTDGDGVQDSADNCTLVANPNQRDTDGDNIGNFCDADLDNNCVVSFTDLAIFKSVFGTPDPDADFDGDGLVVFSDLGIFTDLVFEVPGPSGLPNACGGG